MGLCLGGVSTGLLASLLGGLASPLVTDPVLVVTIVVLSTFIVAGEFGLHQVLLPHRRSLVPSGVVGRGGRNGALQFGFEMGTGLRTHMPSNLPYLLVAAIVLANSLVAGVAAGAGFGIGRAWMALGRHSSNHPDEWDEQWIRWSTWITRTLTLVSVLALLTLISVGEGWR